MISMLLQLHACSINRDKNKHKLLFLFINNTHLSYFCLTENNGSHAFDDSFIDSNSFM